MHSIALGLRAVRAPFFTATALSVLLGGVLAWHSGAVLHGPRLLLTLLGVLFVHAGVNVLNDWFDHRSGLDAANRNPTPFSGGSRVIQDGLVRPRSVLFLGLSCMILAAGTGLYLNAVTPGNAVLVIGLIGFFFGYFYTGLPIRIGYTVFGELVTGIGCGPLIVCGTYVIQTRSGFPAVPLLASVPIGLLVGLILYANQFPDYPNDKAAGKKHIVALCGLKTASRLYILAVLGLYAYTLIAVLAGWFPPLALAVLLAIPLAWKNIRTAWIHYDDSGKFLAVNAGTIGLHTVYTLLLIAGFAADRILRMVRS